MSDLEFIDRCYERDGGALAWSVKLAEALARLVPEADGVMAASYQLGIEGGRFLLLTGDRRYVDSGADQRSTLPYMQALNRSARRSAHFRESWGVGRPSLVSLSEVNPAHQGILRGTLPWRNAQMLGLFATLDGSSGVCLAPGGDEPLRLGRRRRSQLTRLCEHLAVGYWLRALRAPGVPPLEASAEVIFSPEGKVLHCVPPAPLPGAAPHLVDAVRGMERARCRRQRRSPEEATQLWQALVGGQYALVEELQRNGRRVILAVRCRTRQPALTEREAAVARHAARGMANKHIAAELGIATSTVGVHVSSVLRKLRLPGRWALASWF